MIYNIKGFHRDGDGNWEVVPEDGKTVSQHIKQEAKRLGIYSRGDLHRVQVSPGKDQTDVSAGEGVTITLSYITRNTDPEATHGVADSVNTSESGSFEVEIVDPDGMVTTQTFTPTDGEASFTLTPDKVGTWVIRSTLQSDQYIDERATIEGV